MIKSYIGNIGACDLVTSSAFDWLSYYSITRKNRYPGQTDNRSEAKKAKEKKNGERERDK